ncbi:hypothetical protein COW64_08310 [bacterium (Candidatus Blackallbacteria) CG18_big_fil_WC_8_21_14_2_50_49_26]|nr:MAG: hypothetical protein COW64_08310 [bacterium (Candidatus Blackallbacteria) CG18_big_fil_WC_8_21_14_2_50_49_26]
MNNSNAPSPLWKQLKTFEQRGDLSKQAEILESALSNSVLPHQIHAALQISHQNALAYAERHPEPAFSLDQEKASLKLIIPGTGQLLKELPLPREISSGPPPSWSAFGQIEMLLLQIQSNKLSVLKEFSQLPSEQRALSLNSSYACLNNNDYQSQLQSIFCRSLTWGQIPIEPVQTRPFDLYLSPRHPILVVTDRGAGKMHLIQREPLRLMRTWKVVQRPSKKAISIAFHPDGKRIFSTQYEPGSLLLTDRAMAQKKIPVPSPLLLGNLALPPKADRLYILGINPENRRPDLLVLDTEKFKILDTLVLEGEAFSTGADARDLFEISPDGRWGIVMVSKNQPALFTPCLLLIDLEQGKIVDRLILPTDKKPLNLGFLARQLVHSQFRLLPILLHSQGIDPESVRNAFGIEHLD